MQYLENYSGLGASYRDGARWNLPNSPVLYFAWSPAVALLEMSHYIPSPRLVPAHYRMGIYQLPDSIHCDPLTPDRWPDDWYRYPYPLSTQTLGSDWLQAGQSLILTVPSCAVVDGLESIAVINPQHSDIKSLRLIESSTKLYNPRMFQSH